MPNIVEGNYLSDFIKEDDRNYCRDEAVLRAGAGSDVEFVVGEVVSRLPIAVVTATAGNTGNGTYTSQLVGPNAVVGTYKFVCIEEITNSGVFEVITPEGTQLGTNFVVGAGSTDINGHMVGAINDGATDFVVGDSFTFSVPLGDVAKFDPTDLDESDSRPVGIICADATAPNGVKGACVLLVRGPAIVVKDKLVFPTGITADQKLVAYARLENLGIKLVEGV